MNAIVRTFNFTRNVGRLIAGPMDAALAKRLGLIYSGFILRRFKTYSAGGGDWAPLAPSTVAARSRKKTRRGAASMLKVDVKKTGGAVAMLRDTGTLMRALALGGTGNRLEFDAKVAWFGVGSLPHGDSDLGVIAHAHQHGVPGRIPARPFLVDPDETTRQQLLSAVKAYLLPKLRRGVGGR